MSAEPRFWVLADTDDRNNLLPYLNAALWGAPARTKGNDSALLVGIVDEEAGGIVAFASELMSDNIAAALNALHADAEEGDSLGAMLAKIEAGRF